MKKVVFGMLCCALIFAVTACTPVLTDPITSDEGDQLFGTPSEPVTSPDDGEGETEDSSGTNGEKTPEIIGAAANNDDNEPQGNSAVVGGKWPDNEFTKVIPELTTGNISMSMAQKDSFELIASDVSLEAAKTYIDDAIEMGYTENAKLQDYTESGIEAYTYTADNEDGYTLCISYSVGLFSLSLER